MHLSERDCSHWGRVSSLLWRERSCGLFGSCAPKKIRRRGRSGALQRGGDSLVLSGDTSSLSIGFGETGGNRSFWSGGKHSESDD